MRNLRVKGLNENDYLGAYQASDCAIENDSYQYWYYGWHLAFLW